MKKGIFILLVSLFVLLAIGKIAHQLRSNWQQQQNLYLSLQENIASQKAKLQEIDDDISRTKTKATLSEHDRWLIAHLSKSREKLATLIAGLEQNQQHFHRPLIRQWVGHGFMLVVFMAMAVLALSGRSNHLTREEKRWLDSGLNDIPQLQLNPALARDTTAPLSNASNFVTGRIKPRSRHELHITRSSTLTAMGLAFLLAPQGTLAVDIYYLFNTLLTTSTPFSELPWHTLSNSLMVSIPFALAGFYVLFFTTGDVRIDRHRQQIRLQSDKPAIDFREVESLQLNQLLTTGERSFVNSQIQLNLRDGQAVSLLSHAGKDQIYVDLIRVALFMDKPVAIGSAQ
ncbi:hypothetical protein [Alcanivorax nanhaiticus]|nr:hypothetical protein [Alcanivorax nanhaiticus]